MKFEINGVSFPFGVISWNKSISTKEMFAHLLLFLESKRILINPIEMEKKEWCIESVLEIKQKLITITEGLELNDNEKEIILNLNPQSTKMSLSALQGNNGRLLILWFKVRCFSD